MSGGPPAAPGGRMVDLHSHTHFSDGSLSPEALVDYAIQRKLAALSITDHDSIGALVSARAAAGPHIEIVPGIELSCALGGSELHLLGYFIDPLDEGLLARLTRFREERFERAMALVERLNQLGFAIESSRVLELAGPGVVGRPHVATALIEAGHVANMDEAFRRFLSRGGQAFIARPAFEPAEAIALVHGAGGVSVIAHPGSSFTEDRLRPLVDAGLRGIEIWHPQHGPSTVRRLRAMAETFDLLETGGSDFHGPNRGVDLGEIPVPVSVIGHLKEAAGVSG